MIRLAKISDIDGILEITRSCAAKMQGDGIYQWNEHYPSKQAFLKDLERGELYIKEVDGKLVGAIVVSTFMDEEYVPVQWLTPNCNSSYIHRICVDPKLQGKGHAQKLMDFAEEQSREKGFASVRLDTFSQNKRNQRFYEQRGYQKLGDIFFPKQSSHPFHCYELVL
ncbi:GNAT family N-acetyltransferase [Flagellimonas algicola]|uniref:GNAT family N-acetyltransferase n=1 Tax=Flagellimonas algicola TaxID=2583815 RepID=A0ABY2WKR3_9FLAO|nr:GNAT family N-acetyltransferase [Allomuricauda algicola]TMU55156.1 GNAT family N-acetyltransferase [Allomuricauda algicola]